MFNNNKFQAGFSTVTTISELKFELRVVDHRLTKCSVGAKELSRWLLLQLEYVDDDYQPYELNEVNRLIFRSRCGGQSTDAYKLATAIDDALARIEEHRHEDEYYCDDCEDWHPFTTR